MATPGVDQRLHVMYAQWDVSSISRSLDVTLAQDKLDDSALV
jgi:hypothetical protein